MPLVTLTRSSVSMIRISHLEIFCKEIIPAALHSPKHPLNPGDVQLTFITNPSSSLMTVPHLIQVNAEHDGTRMNKQLHIPKQIGDAFKTVFREDTAVGLSLSLAAYYSTHPVEMAPAGMDLPDAIERAIAQIEILEA